MLQNRTVGLKRKTSRKFSEHKNEFPDDKQTLFFSQLEIYSKL